MFRRLCVLNMTLPGPRGRNCCLNEWSSGPVVAWSLPCLVIQTKKGSGELYTISKYLVGCSVLPLLPSFQGRETRFGQKNSSERSGKKSGWQWDAAVNGILLCFGWLRTHQGDILWPKQL